MVPFACGVLFACEVVIVLVVGPVDADGKNPRPIVEGLLVVTVWLVLGVDCHHGGRRLAGCTRKSWWRRNRRTGRDADLVDTLAMLAVLAAVLAVLALALGRAVSGVVVRGVAEVAREASFASFALVFASSFVPVLAFSFVLVLSFALSFVLALPRTDRRDVHGRGPRGIEAPAVEQVGVNCVQDSVGRGVTVGIQQEVLLQLRGGVLYYHGLLDRIL